MATIADELNAISVEHGYTGAAPKTIAGAIDALADTLAGTDVEERRTIAGAVKALAPYISSGGGGTTLGELQIMPTIVNPQPRVGVALDAHYSFEVAEMRVGSQVVFNNSSDNYVFIDTVAAGITVIAHVDEVSRIEGVSTYLATGTEDDNVLTIETLEDFDLDVSVDSDHDTISFVMPELDADEGQFPIMYIERGII